MNDPNSRASLEAAGNDEYRSSPPSSNVRENKNASNKKRRTAVEKRVRNTRAICLEITAERHDSEAQQPTI